MTYYFRNYIFSIIIIVVIIYLSLFTPPKTSLDEINNFDKLVHISMYGGLTLVLWIQYLIANKIINKIHLIIGAIILPIIMSGVIELMQAYLTTNRTGDWLDFLFNCLGVLLSSLIGYYILIPKFNKKRK